jgi:hypothetical protein
MMNSSPAHILTQTRVLTSFHVAKKVTQEEIEAFSRKHKKRGKKEQEIGNMLREKILGEIHTALITGTIPGLIAPQEIHRHSGLDRAIVEKMPDLNRLVMVVTQKMVERKYDKMSMCYVINSMVNLLGLSEKDFEKFHQQRSRDDDNTENGADSTP